MNKSAFSSGWCVLRVFLYLFRDRFFSFFFSSCSTSLLFLFHLLFLFCFVFINGWSHISTDLPSKQQLNQAAPVQTTARGRPVLLPPSISPTTSLVERLFTEVPAGAFIMQYLEDLAFSGADDTDDGTAKGVGVGVGVGAGGSSGNGTFTNAPRLPPFATVNALVGALKAAHARWQRAKAQVLQFLLSRQGQWLFPTFVGAASRVFVCVMVVCVCMFGRGVCARVLFVSVWRVCICVICRTQTLTMHHLIDSPGPQQCARARFFADAAVGRGHAHVATFATIRDGTQRHWTSVAIYGADGRCRYTRCKRTCADGAPAAQRAATSRQTEQRILAPFHPLRSRRWIRVVVIDV
jgi:hypothetical protein